MTNDIATKPIHYRHCLITSISANADGPRDAVSLFNNKKHLKNVGPIRYCEPPLHCQSPGVASRTPAIAIAQAACDRLSTTTTTTTRDRGDRYGPMEWAQKAYIMQDYILTTKQEIGWEERLQNDLLCVEWVVKS